MTSQPFSVALFAAVVLVASLYASAQPPLNEVATRPTSIENEVLANLRAQRIDERQTLNDYQLPESFLRTVADRAIRESFEERHRIVVRDGMAASTPPGESGAVTTDESRLQTSRGGMSRWFGLLLLVPLGIVGLVLLARRKKAVR